MAKSNWVNGAAWPSSVNQGQSTIGLDPQEYRQFNILRRRYLTQGGCQINVTVGTTVSTYTVKFVRNEPDLNYGVQVTPSWGTTVSTGTKSVNQVVLNFGTASPGTGTPTIDVLIHRSES